MDTIHSWVTRYQRVAPLTALTVERARFDTQRLLNPEITGIAYQQGTLAGYLARPAALPQGARPSDECRAPVARQWGRTNPC